MDRDGKVPKKSSFRLRMGKGIDFVDFIAIWYMYLIIEISMYTYWYTYWYIYIHIELRWFCMQILYSIFRDVTWNCRCFFEIEKPSTIVQNEQKRFKFKKWETQKREATWSDVHRTYVTPSLWPNFQMALQSYFVLWFHCFCRPPPLAWWSISL